MKCQELLKIHWLVKYMRFLGLEEAITRLHRGVWSMKSALPRELLQLAILCRNTYLFQVVFPGLVGIPVVSGLWFVAACLVWIFDMVISGFPVVFLLKFDASVL